MIAEPMTTTLYLAGPMSGYEDYNRPAFYQAAEKLRAQGFSVLNPAETRLGDDATWSDYMRGALRQISVADGAAFLPAWEHSRGARLERKIARDLGIPWLPVRYWHIWAAGEHHRTLNRQHRTEGATR